MTRRAGAPLLLLLAACVTNAPLPKPAPREPAPPQLVTSGVAKRVLLVSFDGLGADELKRFGAPAFEAMAAHATRVIPVTPTVTSTTHAAILTGAGPEKSGIVANVFHAPGTPREQVTRGFDTKIAVDTIADIARRAGKRVGSIAFPFMNGELIWTTPVVRSKIIRLTRGDFHPEWVPPAWGTPSARHVSYSAVMRTRIEWSVPKTTRQDVDVVAYDTTNDGVANYDAFFIETGGAETAVDDKRWFAVSTLTNEGRFGSWSKILAVDPKLASMTIYWGAIGRNRGENGFVREVDGQIGFWPGAPDEESVRAGLIDGGTFTEQLKRLSDFLTRVTEHAMATRQFDLLLAYQPMIDEASHQFMASDGEGVRRAAYAAFDRAVASLTRDATANGGAIVITGDHGLARVDTEVRLGRILADMNEPQWSVFAGGNVAHFYRFGGDDDTEAFVKKLTTLGVFERIDRKTPASHPNSGDLVAFAYPRYALSSSSGDAYVKPLYSGQHGGLSSHPEFHTTLGAQGDAIPPQTIEAMPQTGIAPFVLRLLGLSASTAAGDSRTASP